VTEQKNGIPAVLRWVGVGLILAIGVIHLMTAPDQFDDATYKGLLFLANAAGAVIVAIGLWRSYTWAWVLGLVISAATAAGYLLSRTLGLPGLPVDPELFEPLGIAAVFCEVAFVVLAIFALSSGSKNTFVESKEQAASAV
jgi:hypothetical protein